MATGPIAYNASAATVQAALQGLSTIGSGNVSVIKDTDTQTSQIWQVTFTGSLVDTNVSQITIDSTNVTANGMKVNTQGTVTNGGLYTYEVQVAQVLNANAGTFTLSFQGQTTAGIDWDALPAELDAALEALSTIDTVTVGGTPGDYTITFTGTHSGVNVPQLTGDASSLENHQNRLLLFSYDAADQLTAASDPAAAYSYVYDKLGRVTQQTQTIAGLVPQVVLSQAFDAASNRTELSATIGGNADFKNTYVYDNLNRLTRVTQEGDMMGNAVAAKRVDFAYNAAGQFDTISRYESLDTSAPVATTAHGYDGMGRLTSLAHQTDGGATTLASYAYTYDADSRITSVNSLTDGLSTFTYDVTNQLTGADHATQPDETYSFDLNGNRTMAGYSIGTNNRLLSDGTYNYTYDNEGNRISRTKISTGEQTLYDWDHRNRLTKVTEKNAQGAVVSTTENSYDVFDHWIRRSYDADGAGAGSAVDTFFVYDGNQIALQFDGPADSDLSHRYLWGPDVDQFFADEQVTSLSTAGNPLWGLGDHQGTLRDIADRDEMSGSTAVTNHRDYETFGTRLSETNGAVDLIFGYTGRLLDETTGLQDNWHRPYDAKTGSWPTEDPIGFEALDANVRRYVGNNPVNLTDPSGLAPPQSVIPPSSMGIGYAQEYVRSRQSQQRQKPVAVPLTKPSPGLVKLLNSTAEGRKAIRNIIASGAEVRISECVRAYIRTRKDENSPWSEWKPKEWGAMTTKRGGVIIIHIPKSYSDEEAAFFLVHEAAHAIGGGEQEAFLAETLFALECDAARKFARKGFIVLDKDGNESVDKEAIKKFIEERYKGWYEPSPLEEYQKNNDGSTKIDYGKEVPIGPWKVEDK